MESSYLDHYHRYHQEELHSSSLAAPQPFQLTGDNHHQWNQNFVLSGGDFSRPTHDEISVAAPFNSNEMAPEVGFHLACNEEGIVNLVPDSRLILARIKEEQPDYFSKLTDQVNTSLAEGYHQDEKLYLRRLTSECQISGVSLFTEPGNLPSGEGGRRNFSMVFPCGNDLNINPYCSSFSGSMGMDLQDLDLSATSRLGRSLYQTSLDDAALLRDGTSYSLCQLHETVQVPSHRMPSLVSRATEAKRADSTLEHRSSQTAPKRPRLEQRSSFSPIKVRKEKLGDRIAALQQLVAPFGKTDTASVLMEAIGYIKFLQEQVETLSRPFMSSVGKKKQKRTKEASSEEASETKLDLRSRGLCLVPLSCTSYVTSENGGVWSPSNNRG